ncbi:MAG: ribonuclease R [Vicinamibacterales bacterium]|nr:ribonuclease R [Vicinamibacterales bacterium]
MINRENILKLMRDKVTHPATPRELLRTLRIPQEERATFRRLLKMLVTSGELIETKGGRIGLPDKMDLVVGRLETHASGFGFVIPDKTGEATPDVHIPAGNIKEAMHGDRVLARIERRTGDDRIEGRIIRILERGSSTIVGRFDRDESGLGFVQPFDRRVLTDVHIPTGQSAEAEVGEMVAVEITRWPTPARGPVGRVIQVLGNIDEKGVDTEIIIRKFAIPDAHGEAAVEEARGFGTVSPADIAGRTDFRQTTTVTIDGEHARDFDDAISIEKLANGHYWLGVHIADVAHYVQEGSALDLEGYDRATSVYFPDRAVHMFPSELATGICSLNPRVDRLVQSCLMEIDHHGAVVRYEFHDGVINTAARMTYTDVHAILTEKPAALMGTYRELVPKFELMGELFHVLNGRRKRRGSIDFDLPEAEVVLDDAGRVASIVESERNLAHKLIEEFMLLANETVASYVDGRGMPSLYRIHEQPDPLKVEQFEEFVSGFGYSLAAPPGGVRPRNFQKLLEKLHDKPEARPIAFLMLRTMQKARYAERNLGHFGLAADSYTHFTSPIRRYPDLVVHRMLREVRHRGIDMERVEELEQDLPGVAKHCSDMERRADEAERELVQWKKVRFMADKVGDEFEGYVTGVAAFGLFVQLSEHFVEGLVHVSSMADDYYRFLERSHSLKGENTGKVYQLGQRVKVQVVRVDMDRRQIDLGLVEILETVRGDESRRGPRRSKARPKHEQRKGPRRKQRPGRRERRKRGGRRGR